MHLDSNFLNFASTFSEHSYTDVRRSDIDVLKIVFYGNNFIKLTVESLEVLQQKWKTSFGVYRLTRESFTHEYGDVTFTGEKKASSRQRLPHKT